MISISPQQPKQQYMAKYWSDTLNLSPRMNQESVQPYSATRGVRQRQWENGSPRYASHGAESTSLAWYL